jgi:hypothetical protein
VRTGTGRRGLHRIGGDRRVVATNLGRAREYAEVRGRRLLRAGEAAACSASTATGGSTAAREASSRRSIPPRPTCRGSRARTRACGRRRGRCAGAAATGSPPTRADRPQLPGSAPIDGPPPGLPPSPARPRTPAARGHCHRRDRKRGRARPREPASARRPLRLRRTAAGPRPADPGGSRPRRGPPSRRRRRGRSLGAAEEPERLRRDRRARAKPRRPRPALRPNAGSRASVRSDSPSRSCAGLGSGWTTSCAQAANGNRAHAVAPSSDRPIRRFMPGRLDRRG